MNAKFEVCFLSSAESDKKLRESERVREKEREREMERIRK